MKKRYYYKKNIFDYNEKEIYCTQKQWEYWNRKAISEGKKKFKELINESGMFSENIARK